MGEISRNIAYFIDTHVMGGAERYLLDLMKGVRARGDRPTLVCHDFPALVDAARRELGPDFPIHARVFPSITRSGAAQAGLALNRRWGGRLALLKLPGLLWMYANTLRCFFALVPLLRKAAPQVLHVSAGGYPAAESHRAAVLAGRWLGIPVRVMTVHNRAMPRPSGALTECWLDGLVVSSLRAVTTASTDARDCLLVRRGFPVGVSVIYYGLAPAPPAPGAEALRQELGLDPVKRWIGTIGGLQERKGHAVLLDAFARVRAAVPDAGVVIIGNGPCGDDLKQRAERLGVAADVVFAGYRSDARRYLGAFTIFAFPSTDYECLPYAVLEAMEAGVPTVATRMGGLAEEVVDGETGRLVPPRDPAALAAAIEEILRDPAKAARWAEAGRARRRRLFPLESMVERTRALYAPGGTQ